MPFLRFEHPDFLLLLWAAPALAAIVAAYAWWRRKALQKVGAPGSVQRLVPGWSGVRFWAKNVLFLLAIPLLAIALANPQRGARKQTVKQKSADIFIALDISQSMLAEDVAPSRLELAKAFTHKLIRALAGQRIGLIFFAGDAFLQMPLSTDYEAADMFVSGASPGMLSAQGTAIPRAIELAIKSFDAEPGGGRAIILITDGENHDADAVGSAAQAYNDGIALLAVGAGTASGGPVPIVDSTGNVEYKRDEKGAVVRTRMDEMLLRKLASAGGGGVYQLAQGDAAIEAMRRELNRLQKREMEVRSYSEFESYYQWFLLPAFLLLSVETWISWRKRGSEAP